MRKSIRNVSKDKKMFTKSAKNSKLVNVKPLNLRGGVKL